MLLNAFNPGEGESRFSLVEQEAPSTGTALWFLFTPHGQSDVGTRPAVESL